MAGPTGASGPDIAGNDRVNMAFIALIVAVATIGGFMFGYDSGVINGTQDGLEAAFNLSALGTGFNVGAILLGCAFGAFAAGRLADAVGRRTVMQIAAVMFIISAVWAGAADSSAHFIIARFIGGLGVGAASVLSPAYISEVTPASIRGRLSSVQQIMIITGLTGAFVANYALAKTAGGSTAEFWLGYPAWRWMFWLQVVPAAIYFLALLAIPESPRFLVVKKKDAQAEAVLSKLFGPDAGARKVAEIRASLTADHKPRFADLLDPATRKVRPIVWAGLILAVFQQLVGINIVFYYGAVLWQSVGFSESDALQINILSGVLSIAACLGAVAVIDKIGRKPLLLIGSVGMFVTLGVLAWCFSKATMIDGSLHLDDQTGLTALISANAYVVFFNLSWGPVMWVMLGEMFPNQMRGSALAVAGFAQWIANFAIAVSFPWMAASLGLVVTYGFYSVSALISFFLVQAWVKETRGRELEDMG
ncbi:SP family sugar:H+ symporter-like MFS transporter [Brevundimonas bullata]|uniref:SP family sugar:H+ symporter-like MFS transporter n=1 Tax=Brevundimonas bullata TaxID=13160 RepID=A0A7W7INX3_9CAUL|nr:sugar porter family MFS transporter [Brevundimonas bullata]MBB4797829.1 SP family sugar:H+ symporter-like MFS transporter [Brevundimonas bullata]MBB6382788.1 SP family sugar:H+ symporter-like MFS transporter [Brevundimonas bullata]